MDEMQNNSDSVFQDICGFLEQYNRNKIEITGSTDLNSDLNIDSVAAMDIIMEVEDRYDIDIPINLVADMRTVDDLVSAVQKQKEAG
ncbi:MAG: acyl carrier protein [Pseudomonadota bacterium]|uniref:acyl carrier protein n=1 Tax=Fodinicurvata fenggangensis TaxID=1121830 RepID=UPI001B805E79|nr:acyl carrier protein [Fodinicurvata fenggangensis]